MHKLSRTKSIFLSFGLIITGFVLNGLAWTILPGPTWSSLSLISGLGLIVGGFIFLLLSSNRTN